MAFLVDHNERPAWQPGGVQQRTAGLAGPAGCALLLHGGLVLAILLLASRPAIPPDIPEIEVIWPAPMPAPAAVPAAAAPAAAAPAAAAAPEPAPKPEPEPAPEPEPTPLPAPPPPPPKPKPRPEPKPVAPPTKPPIAQAAPQPQTSIDAEPVPIPPPAASAPIPNPGLAPAPVSATAGPPPSQATPLAAVSAYNGILLDWLRQHLDYPRAARLRRQQGEVRLRLVLDRSGRLLEAALASSSGHDLLDEAALRMAQRAAPYPPPLDALGNAPSAAFVVPLRYELLR